MGGLLCKPEVKEEDESSCKSRRHKRSKLSHCCNPSVTAVLSNYDLLQQILLKLAPGKGCDIATRLQVAQVSRLWRDVSKTLPICLRLQKPLSDKQVEQLKHGCIPCVRHIGFVGSEEGNAHQVLSAAAFQCSSCNSLLSISGLPFEDNMAHLQRFPELRAVGLCRRNWVTLMELVKGTKHSMDGLAGLGKLKSLTLKDLAGPQAALDLSCLPSSLENLHLVNTSFVHHPEMKLPDELHLQSLTASSLGRRPTIVPVELLRKTKQAILRGKEVYLTGEPTDHPEMEDDSMEVVVNGGMLFLFGFGMPQVQHQTSTSIIMQQLENSDLQVLRLCTEAGGTTHLVERSDCRKGLRWKSLEVATPSSFVTDISAAGEAPPVGFSCRVEERHADGSIQSLCLSRSGTPKAEAEAAVEHLTLLQDFLIRQLDELEEHVRHLGEMLDLQAE